MEIRLTLGWMLEAAVGDGSQKFGLQKEIAKASAVYAHIRAFGLIFLFGVAICCCYASRDCWGCCLLVGLIVDQILSHDESCTRFGMTR